MFVQRSVFFFAIGCASFLTLLGATVGEVDAAGSTWCSGVLGASAIPD